MDKRDLEYLDDILAEDAQAPCAGPAGECGARELETATAAFLMQAEVKALAARELAAL